jgi:hypothetical protein
MEIIYKTDVVLISKAVKDEVAGHYRVKNEYSEKFCVALEKNCNARVSRSVPKVIQHRR